MKKYRMILMAVMMLFAVLPFQLRAEAESAKTEVALSKEASAAKATVLLDRLNKIDAMDKSNLSSSEKRSLRKEVTGIKRELKQLEGGVYLSVGAIIIILLILILIF